MSFKEYMKYRWMEFGISTLVAIALCVPALLIGAAQNRKQEEIDGDQEEIESENES